MAHSMTGFARVTGQLAGSPLSIEIRTVNHRYLEVTPRVPEALRVAEPWLREAARQRLARGKVDVVVRWQQEGGPASDITVNLPRLQALRVALDEVAKAVPGGREPDVATLLAWPGVLAEPALEDDDLYRIVQPLFTQALDDLQAHREREGDALARSIEQRLDDIDAIVSDLRAGSANLQQHLSDRLQERLARLQAEVDPDRLQQEIALLLQKSDVAEEIDRLAAHVAETRKVLARQEPIGRRLDFLMQEFNREANTLASKASQSAFTQSAIALKVLIEQMREQIQNIE
ncbi:MAG: YicC family protein [Natronospirillum sp.]|uniref:YicC/YloC family endoribonuclease n=1 Tax=Natronospirillum sp. TaxID=2812955 RepID=UPI0025F69FDD|nr:YicC/YloC family endoribonuclease [Natronospirillum sp.]MCH8552453.1 YicC family protein [Natronospirillum sp.]